MTPLHPTIAALLMTALAAGSPANGGSLSPARLRCEYLENPLGIDAMPPRLSWIVESPERGQRQTAYRILVSSTRSRLDEDDGNLWDSGKVPSAETLHVEYGGRPLLSGRVAHWKVRVWDSEGTASAWSPPAHWQMGILEPEDWKGHWIGLEKPHGDSSAPGPAACLRRAFRLPGPVKRATVHASALGLYELRINGRRAGSRVLAPEWADYNRKVQYQTLDVTALLHKGENVLGALLGDGWYSGRIGIHWIVEDGPTRGIYGSTPRFLLQMDVELEDGSRRTVVSDASWKATLDGPIRKACLLDGEVIDHRKSLDGWDRPGYDDGSWLNVTVSRLPRIRRVAQPDEPIRVVLERKPIAVTEPSPDVFVFDIGQNLVGWCRLVVKGEAGTRITLRHAERLQPDGNVYTENLRTAAQVDTFILAGGGREVFEPHFTCHGFRYVEVRGLEGKPALEALTACVVHSDAPSVATFECSDPGLSRLMENIDWTLRGNLHGIPTDCPQRDERMGWLGDAQVFSETACFLRDLGSFYTKWLRDIRDAQAADGRFPDFAPHPYDSDARFSGAPGWADAGVIIPWRVWVHYGDRRILEESYTAARRWVEYVRSRSPELLWTQGRGNDYNDWLNGNTLRLEDWPRTGAEVPKDLFATAFFAFSTETLARMARVLGRAEDAERYGSLAAAIRRAFQEAFVGEEGTLRGDTQAGYALALHFDLLPDALREAAVKHLLAAVRRYDGHPSTGIQTTARLLLALSRAGHEETAYELITRRDIPSWLYMVDNGATTIWERWDGYVEGRGYQDAGMNSFNHYAFGAVGEWMFREIVGLSPDESRPGYRRFVVRPRPGGGLTWAEGVYDSIRGRIAVSWSLRGEELSLEVTVPANTTAVIHVPARKGAVLTESGVPVEQASRLKLEKRTEGEAIFEAGSGEYRFTVSPPEKKL